jgi:phosphatidylglycerophosphate synthase
LFYGEASFDREDFTPTPALPPQGGGGIKVASSRGMWIGYARKGTDHMKIAAVERYRRLCQKNESENYLLDKYIFRKISIYFTIVAIKLGLTANQATFLSLLAALGSLYFLMFNTARDLLAAAVLIFLYYILDHVDGELARYHIATGRQTPSLQGHYFDLLVHRYSSNLMLFFMAISVYRLFGYEYAVLLGFVACIGVSSFPNVVAAHVLAGRLAHDPGLIESPETQRILQQLERKQGQIEEIRGGPVARLKKILGELLFFPGHIIAIIAVLIIDLFMPQGFILFSYSINFRLLFLVGMVLLFTLKAAVQGYQWIVRFKDIR